MRTLLETLCLEDTSASSQGCTGSPCRSGPSYAAYTLHLLLQARSFGPYHAREHPSRKHGSTSSMHGANGYLGRLKWHTYARKTAQQRPTHQVRAYRTSYHDTSGNAPQSSTNTSQSRTRRTVHHRKPAQHKSGLNRQNHGGKLALHHHQPTVHYIHH